MANSKNRIIDLESNDINDILCRINFNWSESGEYPGPFLKEIIMNGKLTLSDLYKLLNQYIETSNPYFMENYVRNIEQIIGLYNVGLSKNSVLTFYDLLITKIDQIRDDQKLFLILSLFNVLHDEKKHYQTICGLIPYLKTYGLNNEYKKACEIYESIISSLTYDYLEKILSWLLGPRNTYYKETYDGTIKFFMNEFKNDFCEYKKFINDSSVFVVNNHIAKSYRLLQLFYKFDTSKLEFDLKNKACNLYLED